MTSERAATAERVEPGDPTTAQRPAGGLVGLFGTGDHKAIGRLFIGASTLFLALVGTTGVLLGAERLQVGTLDVLDTDSFSQVYSLHWVSTIFLFVLPFLLGIALVVVPLQVGARTVAFPRAAAASFWLWLLSSGLVLAGYAINGGLFGGDYDGVSLFLAAFAVLIVALCLTTVCVVTTVLTLRTTGMTLDRTPLFAWSMLVAGSVWLLTLPVLFGLVVLSYLDWRYGVTGDPTEFGRATFDRFRWAWEQPQIWVYAVPALGLAADVAAVFAGARQRNRGVLMGAIGAAGVLGVGAWTFTRPENPNLVEEALFVAVAVAVVLPVLAVLGGVGQTLMRGKMKLGSPLVFALTGLLMVLTGAGAGALGAIEALDLQFRVGGETTWSTGVFHYVVGGTVLVAIGGLHHWASKLFGRPLREGPAKLAATLGVLGTIGLALPELIAGALDQTAVLPQSARDGVEALNLVSLVGGGLLVLTILIVVLNVIGSLSRRGYDEAVDADPWEGQTLEWLTASPPGPGNFAELPVVTSAAPLLDQREREIEQVTSP
ncbi:MAG: cbb3-type cytochrome c oxidase subunit I [Acidimicrobiales bacterium]